MQTKATDSVRRFSLHCHYVLVDEDVGEFAKSKQLPKYTLSRSKELVKRCIAHYLNSEWLVQTTKAIYGHHEKIGFAIYNKVILTIPSIYQ